MLSSTVTVRRTDDPTRWVQVTLTARPLEPGGRFLARRPSYACHVTPADAAAGEYTADNWESGLLSGLGYAWRRWFRPEAGVGVEVSELTGRLAQADMEGVAFAASAAAHELGGQPPPAHADWESVPPTVSLPFPVTQPLAAAV